MFINFTTIFPTPIGYLAAERVGEAQLKAYREMERRNMSAILDQYLDFSKRAGVSVEKLHIEEGCIKKGIIQLIQQYKIKKLVMGAAADKHYNPKRMRDLISKKAIYVREYAPPYCHIWFVCKGLLIHTRRAILAPIENEAITMEVKGNELLTATEVFQSNDVVKVAGEVWRSRSKSLPISLTSEYQSLSSHEQSFQSGLQIMYNEERKRRKEAEAELQRVKQELEQVRNNAIVELPKVKEELDYMKNQVEDLAKVKAFLEYMKNDVLGELESAIEQKTLLENQIENSTCMLQALGEKLASAINLVNNYGGQYTII